MKKLLTQIFPGFRIPKYPVAKTPNSTLVVTEPPVAISSIPLPPEEEKIQPVSISNSLPTCNICNSTEFKPGPGGRLGNGNIAPACAKCGSLERNRIHRKIFDDIRNEQFKTLSALMFHNDLSIDRDWFSSFRSSHPKGEAPLDVQNIDLPNSAYDVVVCSYILDKVPNYAAAIRELLRVSSDRGFVFLSFPQPHTRAKTVDWGYPKTEHGSYRIFGADVEQEIIELLGDAGILRVVARDNVNNVEDRAYIISRNRDLLREFAQKSTGSFEIA